MHSFWQRLERFSGKMTPAVLTVFMVLIAAVPLHMPGITQFMPAFVLISIYYWGVFYPGTMPYAFLFALGLLQDALLGTPLGVSSFINMIFAFGLIIQRRIFGKTLFGSVWMGFSALSCVALFLQWLLICIVFSAVLPFKAVALQWALTVLFYPLMHLLLTQVYRRIHS